MAAMKWWGWGLEGHEFTHEDKPSLAPFIREKLDLDVSRLTDASVALEDIALPEPAVDAALRAALAAAVGAEHVADDRRERVLHARGKSIRDLVLQRRGEIPRPPDLVVRPADEEAVAAVMAAAVEHDAVLIPFGGGSSISGSIEAEPDEERTVISLDLARLDRVLEVDEASRLARVQAGTFGPDLERQLNARGFTFGHFPDSFTHSTIGGWIATRSSGMQSDRYGDIADLVRGLRVVTPAGPLVVKPIPTTSTGPSVREMILGSEGRLGVITEATVHVRRVAEERTIRAYFFPTWGAGLQAMRDIAASEAAPLVTRISDAPETGFSLATSKASGLKGKLEKKALTTFLERRRGFDLPQMCLSFIGYEGTEAHVKAQRRLVEPIVKAHGGVGVGTGPGELYDQKKFDTPYIRDFLLDRGTLADVSETAAPWSRLTEVYDAAQAAVQGAFDALGVKGYLMCHLSHSYHAGACLYFTFAFTPAPGHEMLADYDVVKKALQQSFVDHGATLSHHHAVGTEHAEWLEQDITAPAVGLVRALFDGADPGRNLNPGKIVRPAAGVGGATPSADAARTNGAARPVAPR